MNDELVERARMAADAWRGQYPRSGVADLLDDLAARVGELEESIVLHGGEIQHGDFVRRDGSHRATWIYWRDSDG